MHPSRGLLRRLAPALLLLSACQTPAKDSALPDDSADTGGGDSGGETGGDSAGETGVDSTGDTGDTAETGDTSASEPCPTLVPETTTALGAWIVDWSALTTDMDGGAVTPRDVSGGAVYAYTLSPADLQAQLCAGGVDPATLYDYGFFTVEAVPPAQDAVTLDAPEGGSLLVRIDKSGGTFLMLGLFEVLPSVDPTTEDPLLAITSTSAAWSE